MKPYEKKLRQFLAGSLAVIMLLMVVMPGLPPGLLSVRAAETGDTIIAHSEGFHHYCIDGYGANRAMMKGDEYQYILPSQSLSVRERAVVFWSMLSLQASFGNVQAINTVMQNINAQAPARGLPPIQTCVTEEDLKKIIHVDSVRAKYSWMDAVLAHETEYLQMAGLIGAAGGGSGGTSVTGKPVPSVLQGHTAAAAALEIDKSTYAIPFDPGGADADFIAKVPLLFSSSGVEGTYTASPPGGWTYQKTASAITFQNINPNPQSLIVKFDTANTEYQTGTTFADADEVYERCLQLWVCSKCSGTHAQAHIGAAPLEAHQRLVFVEIEDVPASYYAALGGSLAVIPGGEGGLAFQIYRHEEDFTSTYNLQMFKYDHETGKPLEDAVFNLYERFDDQDEIDRERDGAVTIYEGGAPYQSYHKDNPVIWEDFRFVSSIFTDQDGHAEKTVNHGYHYDKTFCDGHPAPSFVLVPEEEEDPETGEIENEAEIEAAREENRKLARSWLDCFASCEEKAQGDFSGVHFHWLMDSVSRSEIESISGYGGSPGETPSAGSTASASGETSFSQSGCQEDVDATYDAFIALKYSYALMEETARTGYTNHGLHADDLPIEIISTDASQNGANASFAGAYGNEIQIKRNLPMRSARTILAERAGILAGEQGAQLDGLADGKEDDWAEGPTEDPGKFPEENPEHKPGTILQKILRFFLPARNVDDAEEDSDLELDSETALINDLLKPEKATGSNTDVHQGTAHKATASNATASNAVAALSFSQQREATGGQADSSQSERDAAAFSQVHAASSIFASAYQMALAAASSGEDLEPGPEDNYSHCDDADGEGDAWRIYDHRTEGELHINKRDMELEKGQAAAASGNYDSYGDSQGDGTLEGAVYGLFAAEDLVHPDGKTGVVYRRDNLVAVAATDKEGDASFLTNTEAPGYHYDYTQGAIVTTQDAWSAAAPGNRYTADVFVDDYTADGRYERQYYDYEAKNGNCWIGRPLLLGEYYIRELTRSEGYELSVGNRANAVTNLGQEYEVSAAPAGTGYANITGSLFAEAQISGSPTGDYRDPDYNELFFHAESTGTGAAGFDLVLNNLPEGTRLYRLDTAIRAETVEVGTGIYEEVGVVDADGNPVYVTAEHAYQYPKYNLDGSLMTEPAAVSAQVHQILSVEGMPLDEAVTQESLLEAESGMTAEEVRAKLASDIQAGDAEFIREKLRKALRANGKHAPKPDAEPSGYPIVTLQVEKQDAAGVSLTVGDLLATILDYYNTNDFYNYGGLERIEEEARAYGVTIYAGRLSNPPDFFVPDQSGSDADAGVIYHRVEYLPEDSGKASRYLYATYAGDLDEAERNTFGRYENVLFEEFGGSRFVSATLIPDAQADRDGGLVTKKTERNLYYAVGETPLDAAGNPIRKMEYREQTAGATQEAMVGKYTELPITTANPAAVFHVQSSYTDGYGAAHEDTNGQQYAFKLVLPERFVTLTVEDIASMTDPGNWAAGDRVGTAAYYTRVQFANVRAYLDYENRTIGGDNSYAKPAELVYPGQEYVWQDGANRPGTNTRKNPVGVQQRAIKQQIKVTKVIRDAENLDHFRFKTYLKSNLERLYRDEDGTIIWQDRKGQEIDILAVKAAFPALVSRINTRVLHRTDPLYQDSQDAVIANTELYSFTDDFINAGQNDGFTALLETTTRVAEDGLGIRVVPVYNYDKFFSAIAVANHDKWDDAAPTYTSWRPVGNAVNRTEDTLLNTRVSDQVRQFAVDWYLDEEVKKQVREVANNPEETEDEDGQVAYSEELYDHALRQAVIKAENYLKPFFAYDLDEIYAIAWDKEKGGGSDHNLTTVSADSKSDGGEGYYFGISAYLPYGTYVIAEQQPQYDELEDFANRHYEIDRPREVTLPAAYESYAGSQASPEVENGYYHYDSGLSQAELERRYHIRFNEETHIIYAHSNAGDFEVYKYGQDVDRITNGVPAVPKAGNYFALTQSEYRPYKNGYNEQDVRKDAENPYYLSEGQSGRTAISGHYRYSSVSEQAGTADAVPYPGGPVTEENVPGIVYRDQVKTMHGMLTAYDGKYAAMLVPYTMKEPDDGGEEATGEPEPSGESSYAGYGYSKFCNRPFTARLRIEKLDSETHENILHDDAIFNLYAAKREEKKDGNGAVLFYETATTITGTKEFLESMRAVDIRPMVRRMSWMERLFGQETGPGNLYSGLVPPGTPVCEESDRIVLGSFKSYSTVREGGMKEEMTNLGQADQRQTVGYLETPQVLAAGTYVICEAKAPAGYNRTKPMALEIYSDQVTYYKEGNQDDRILAALYEYESEDRSANGNKPQDLTHVARINVENAPIRLQVEKLKETGDGTWTYKVSGRIDGSLTAIGNDPNYVYAYENGIYLGYAWRKGTLEYLAARKQAGEDVKLVYHGNQFAGYGYVTRTVRQEKQENPYVPGATMTLFDALELAASGDTQDHAWEGLVVERNQTGNVTRMYVREGYAGEKTGFVQADDALWSAVTLKRHDTDILYYDLDSLELPELHPLDGASSIFAFKGGMPYLEFVGGDFSEIAYHPTDKVLEAGKDTKVYHLDRDGSRDALVDPYTGLAYVETVDKTADGRAKRLVWPVNIHRDIDGNLIARDKITTSRLASVGEVTEDTTYLTGSWKSEQGEESHRETSLTQNEAGQNQNNEVLADDNNGAFAKEMNPVFDRHGLTEYYQRSEETYDKSTDLYDRNGVFVRQQDSDNLEEYNVAAYRINEHGELYDGEELREQQDRKKLYHRLGEGYLLENTWVTSDQTPNDPFHENVTDGQPDVLKRVPEGHYILEELKSPAGYLKGMPTAVTVRETEELQTVSMTDQTTKIEIGKVDGGAGAEGGVYSYGLVEGAELELYAAERTYTTDLEQYPKGYYLQKKDAQPLWSFVTGETPAFLEGLPLGDYLLEEVSTPEGFVTAKPLELEVSNTPNVQTFLLYEDHTKVEVEKYRLDGGEHRPLGGAGFTLYPAKLDAFGNVLYDAEGRPQYEEASPAANWTTVDRESCAAFAEAFEEMYHLYGVTLHTSVVWSAGGTEHRAEYVSAESIDASIDGGRESLFPTKAVLVFRTEEGMDIRISVYGQQDRLSGRDFIYEYQFDWKELSQIHERAKLYQTIEGRTRLEYLPVGSSYVLVETEVVPGFAQAEPLVITISDTEKVLHYEVENVESALRIAKTAAGRDGELTGAHLGLYRPDEGGNFCGDEEHLIADWITGEDGVYTDLDEVNGRIPEGYQKGDWKPHTIRRLPDGIYWLAERKSPDYYTTFEPLRIEYHQSEEIRVITVSNVPVRGQLEIRKTDADGNMLTGAVFELSAYTSETMQTPVLKQMLYGTTALIRVEDLPVGAMQKDGSIQPYWYRLKEVIPPEGYAVNAEVFEWKFAPDKQGVSFALGESAQMPITVANQKTQVVIGKRDFAQTGVFVAGAKLAVYELLGRGENQEFLYDEAHPIETWITTEADQEEPGAEEQGKDAQAGHVLEGLIAGRSYLLKELQAPSGYHTMEPILFTLSQDGRKISEVSNQLETITVQYREASEIESITIKGRCGIRVEYESRTQEAEFAEATETEATETTEVAERTIYSDGTALVTGAWTMDAEAAKRFHMLVSARTVERVTLSLESEDGTKIAAFSPQSGKTEWTILEQGADEEARFRKGAGYVLCETTAYSDGTSVESNRLAFTLGEDALVKRLLALDRKTEVVLSKVEITGGAELPGCQMTLTNQAGEVLDSWISEDQPHRLEGILEPGATYVLREERPADGYAFASEISFTVKEDGTVDHVIMADEVTRLTIQKIDADTGKPLAGAKFEIRDRTGAVVVSWISQDRPQEISGLLTAGADYILHEVKAPAGYLVGEDLHFSMPEKAEVLELICKNQKKPDRPDSGGEGPEQPKPQIPTVTRIGRITASYVPETRIAGGWLYLDESGHYRLRLPGTGQGTDAGLAALLFAGSLLGFWILILKRRKR
ncbi:MAG: SpaA isopeptide-forming pilin-related protein [Lachnospiraceae bacterium]|nr:SpaA isopeptide-forming pilin-related protein [Lachnospiraceae bacterium]